MIIYHTKECIHQIFANKHAFKSVRKEYECKGMATVERYYSILVQSNVSTYSDRKVKRNVSPFRDNC